MEHFSGLKQIIAQLLRDSKEEVPATYQDIGAWMAKNLPERGEEFNRVEAELGLERANQWLMEAMIYSGRYVREDDFLIPNNFNN